MNKKSVYIETSIVSYLTARPSSDLLAAAWQKVTVDWWDSQKNHYELFTSNVVLEEASRGCPESSAKRLEVLAEIPLLTIPEEAVSLSQELIQKGALPDKAIDDALHVAISAVHDIDHLLTWNCRHLANVETKQIFSSICVIYGYTCPEICTPQVLIGVYDNDG